jgi:sec-independent protein translocase protein TatA
VNLGPIEIGLIVLAVMLLSGYKKLPDASRSLGRSLRIFKGELDGLRDAQVPPAVAADAPAHTQEPRATRPVTRPAGDRSSTA